MKINPINLFLNNYSPKKAFPPRKTGLSPLACDTVSFSGRVSNKRKETNINKISTGKTFSAQISSSEDKKVNHSERGSLRAAQSLYDEGEYVYGYFKYILKQTFNTKVLDIDCSRFNEQYYQTVNANRDKPVVMILARRKKPASISEKMSSRHVRSKAGAKKELNDLIGAKIIVSGNSTKEGDYVIEKLTEAVKKGHLKVTSVKAHSQEDKKLNYATNGKINKLVEASRKNGEPLCSFIDQPRDSGYLAIHVITGELTDGFNAEIQIVGYDVAKFKDLEDLCYKCHAGKNIPSKYDEIKTLFEPIKNNKTLQRDYLEYTKRAYAYERRRANGNRESGEISFLPVPKDLNIPKELDFNNIYKIKTKIDRNFDFISQTNLESAKSAGKIPKF